MVLAIVRNPRTDIIAVASTIVVANCGHRCWLSPEGSFMLDKTRAYTVCMECGSDLMKPNPDSRVYYPEQAMDEIERRFGIAEADQARSFMRDLGGKPWPG